MIDHIELHMFSNSTVNAPCVDMFADTYESFVKTFGVRMIPIIWVDPNPYTDKADEYIDNLRKMFPNSIVTKTVSFSDSYIKAIRSSQQKFLFMLEHDWRFLPNINHSLQHIVKVMDDNNILHLRFNKRMNAAVKWDKNIKSRKVGDINMCFVTNLSNNPHIINRKLYIDTAYKYVAVEPGSKGIEEKLKFSKKANPYNIEGAIYGSLGYKPTIKHVDGRKKYEKKK